MDDSVRLGDGLTSVNRITGIVRSTQSSCWPVRKLKLGRVESKRQLGRKLREVETYGQHDAAVFADCAARLIELDANRAYSGFLSPVPRYFLLDLRIECIHKISGSSSPLDLVCSCLAKVCTASLTRGYTARRAQPANQEMTAASGRLRWHDVSDSRPEYRQPNCKRSPFFVSWKPLGKLHRYRRIILWKLGFIKFSSIELLSFFIADLGINLLSSVSCYRSSGIVYLTIYILYEIGRHPAIYGRRYALPYWFFFYRL